MRETARICDDFARAVFLDGDLDAATALLHDTAEFVNTPGVAVSGIDAIRAHLRTELIPHTPSELRFSRISRTVDRLRLVDEQRVGFIHDRVLPWLLPGVEPTGEPVEALAITVAVVRQGRLIAHRTLWDRTALPGPG